MSKYIRSPKLRQKILEGKRRQNKFDNTVGAKLHKKHKEMFGVEPVFFGATDKKSPDYLDKIRDAIRTGKPLDKYAALPPDMKVSWEQGIIEID